MEHDKHGKRDYISETELVRALATPDLTTEEYADHGIGQLYKSIEDLIFSFEINNTKVVRKSPVVSIRDHYDDLLFPPDAGIRSDINSRYINDEIMLRGHSASMVPEEIVTFSKSNDDEIMLICPGICFRSKTDDRNHVSILHQVDIWYIKKASGIDSTTNMEFALSTSEKVIESVLPGYIIKQVPIEDTEKTHPYLSSGYKIKVDCDIDGMTTVLECGTVGSGLLEKSGLGNGSTGIAIGIILERTMMIRKGLKDARLIKSEKPGVKEQMFNLEKYIDSVESKVYKRTLSLAVTEDSLDKIISNIESFTLDKLGISAHAEIEEITQYSELPEEAIVRYGMSNNQVNLLVSIYFEYENAQSRKDINEIRDIVYAKFHEGSRSHLSQC